MSGEEKMSKLHNEGQAESIPFYREIYIDPESIGIEKRTSDNRVVQVKLIFNAEGMKLQKASFDMTKVPKDVDDAEFDAAISYDKDPKVEVLDIDPHKIDEILAKMQASLEAEVREDEAKLEDEEDDWTAHQISDYLGSTKIELEEIIRARKIIKS